MKPHHSDHQADRFATDTKLSMGSVITKQGEELLLAPVAS